MSEAEAKRRELLGTHYKEGGNGGQHRPDERHKNIMNENLQLLNERGEN